MGHILSALCEEKIDYPERLSKQEKETGWSVNVSRVPLQAAGRHKFQSLLSTCCVRNVNPLLFKLYSKYHEIEKGTYV